MKANTFMMRAARMQNNTIKENLKEELCPWPRECQQLNYTRDTSTLGQRFLSFLKLHNLFFVHPSSQE